MPNHFQNVLLCSGTYEFDAKKFEEEHEKTNWCERVRPVYATIPNASCIQQEREWGVKWGTYSTQAMSLNGDGGLAIIAFCTPWTAPNDDVLRLIAKDICELCGFTRCEWISYDPANDLTSLHATVRANSGN